METRWKSFSTVKIEPNLPAATFSLSLSRRRLVKGYHLKWSQMKTDPNIAKWSVQMIELDQNKRHLDCARLRTFWETLDQ